MQQDNFSFNKKLEKMISLLRKIKDNSEKAKLRGLDDSFFKNVDFIISNYEMIKNQMPVDFVEKTDSPLFGLMNNVFDKIYADLQEMMAEYNLLDIVEDFDNNQEETVIKEAETQESTIETDEIDEIDKINELLKEPGITEEEMNQLLDIRSDLLAKSSNS